MNKKELQDLARILTYSKLALQCLNIAISGTNSGNFTLENGAAITKTDIERTIYFFNEYWKEIQIEEDPQ